MGQEWANRTEMVALYASKLAFFTNAIIDAQRMLECEGPHPAPWDHRFQTRTAEIYRMSLPDNYLARLAGIFKGCTLVMDAHQPPADIQSQWDIVYAYFQNGSNAIAQHLDIEPTPRWQKPETPRAATPLVVRFELIAKLAQRPALEQQADAGRTIARHFTNTQELPITKRQLELLQRLYHGQTASDIAYEMGCSRRTLFREQKQLWQDLEVDNRTQALTIAGENGWLR